jgi:hypothetical protein
MEGGSSPLQLFRLGEGVKTQFFAKKKIVSGKVPRSQRVVLGVRRFLGKGGGRGVLHKWNSGHLQKPALLSENRWRRQSPCASTVRGEEASVQQQQQVLSVICPWISTALCGTATAFSRIKCQAEQLHPQRPPAHWHRRHLPPRVPTPDFMVLVGVGQQFRHAGRTLMGVA